MRAHNLGLNISFLNVPHTFPINSYFHDKTIFITPIYKSKLTFFDFNADIE